MLYANEAALMSHAPLSTNTAKLFQLCEDAVRSALRSGNCIVGLNGLITNKAAHIDVSSWKDTAVIAVMTDLTDKYKYKCVVRAIDACPSVLIISWEHIEMKE